MTTNATARRLRRAAAAYALDTWGIELRKITADEVLTMEIRADGYSNAHVEGEHESNGLCSFTGKLAARDCGEAGAAAEFVETMDNDVPDAHAALTPNSPTRTTSHAACTHPATKSARAACRRATKEN